MMSEKRFKKMDTIIDPFPIWDTVKEKGYNCTDTLDLLVDLLNEQQATIEMYQRRVDKREEQISIIKKHCLKFLTDEQFETIRKELDKLNGDL